MIRSKSSLFGWTAVALFVGFVPVRAEEPPLPLHARIDQIIDEASCGVAAPIVSDAEFLRRVSLDLTGIPPTTDELRAFLADASEKKREAAVDDLLGRSRSARHFAEVFDVLLMERRPAKAVTHDAWMSYLEASFRDNKPLNVLFRELLSADGVDPALRPAARFYLDRDGDPDLLTRDVGRIVFGRDLQCAQCHNSPIVEDYLQADYKGLYAFFAGGVVVTKQVEDKPVLYYGEKASGDIDYESVFVKGARHVTAARIPADIELDEPFHLPGEEYVTPPADGVVSVPKFSRRSVLAERATDGSNRYFNENLANRLWELMMGRGLVHPTDMHHWGNPPTHPKLLALLGAELAAGGFQFKSFLRELALTKVYQRAMDLPADPTKHLELAEAKIASLEQARPELASRLEQAQSAHDAALEKYLAAEAPLVPAVDELNAARAKGVEAQRKTAAADQEVAKAKSDLGNIETALARINESVAKAEEAGKLLPGDQELAQTLAKLKERIAPVTASIEAQQKVVADKEAARKALDPEVESANAAISAAHEKVLPLREPVRTLERELLSARQQLSSAVVELARLDARNDLLREYVRLEGVEQQVAVASKEKAATEGTLLAAREEMADQAMAIAERQMAVTEAEQAVQSAGSVKADRQRDHVTEQRIADIFSKAYAVSESAHAGAPQMGALAEIKGMLEAERNKAQSNVETMSAALTDAAGALERSTAALADRRKDLASALSQTTEKYAQVKTIQVSAQEADEVVRQHEVEAEEVEKELSTVWASDFTVGALKPLTPEQMCWSLLHITEIDDRYREQSAAELDKSEPMPPEDQQVPEKVADRQRRVENLMVDKLKGNIGSFVSYFGGGAGQPQNDFFATPDQALFVANGGTVISWLAPAGGNVTERAANNSDLAAAAEDIYLTILSRPPSDEERKDVVEYLAGRTDDRPVAVQELIWALVSSAEFRFNH